MISFLIKKTLLALTGTAIIISILWSYIYDIGPCLNAMGFTYAWQGTSAVAFIIFELLLIILFQNRIERFLVEKE